MMNVGWHGNSVTWGQDACRHFVPCSEPVAYFQAFPTVSWMTLPNVFALWLYSSQPRLAVLTCHDDVIKWKHFQRYWPFVRGIHRSPVNSSHKGQWRRALMFSLICTRINGWVNNGEAGDLRRYRAHYDVTVMSHMYTDVTCSGRQ